MSPNGEVRKRLKKTTNRQYEKLLTFVSENPTLIHGKTKPKMQAGLWEKFALEMGPSLGPIKTAEQWKKIFIEWKVNTRRKNRFILENLNRPDVGPGSSKKELNNLEVQLMSLLSKPHVSDPELPDLLGGEPANKELRLIEVKSEELTNQDPLAWEMEMALLEPIDIQPESPAVQMQASKEYKLDVLAPSRPKKKIDTEDTRTFLDGACCSCDSSNKVSNASSHDTSDALKVLASSVCSLAESQAKIAEATTLRARAEYARAKIEHYKVFGNLDDFDNFDK